MARIRSVHPDICASETMASLSAELERTFVRLWTHCDDAGRCLDKPRLIKAALFPLHDDVTPAIVDKHLTALAEAGLLQRYSVNGQPLLEVRSWAEFQHPKHPSASKYPDPPSAVLPPSSPRPPPIRGEAYPETVQGVVVGEGVLEGVGVGGEVPSPNGETSIQLAISVESLIDRVFEAWKDSTGRTGRTRLSKDRAALIRNALKEYPVDDVIDAVRGWQHSAHHRGENDQRMVYNDLDVLLRDAKRIEKFRDLQRRAPNTVASGPVDEATASIQRLRQREGRA